MLVAAIAVANAARLLGELERSAGGWRTEQLVRLLVEFIARPGPGRLFPAPGLPVEQPLDRPPVLQVACGEIVRQRHLADLEVRTIRIARDLYRVVGGAE